MGDQYPLLTYTSGGWDCVRSEAVGVVVLHYLGRSEPFLAFLNYGELLTSSSVCMYMCVCVCVCVSIKVVEHALY